MTDTPVRRNIIRNGRNRQVVTAPQQRTRKVRQKSPSIFIPLFIFSLAIPIVLHLGDIRLSPYRVVLLILIVPLCYFWLSGKMGRKRPPDYLVLFFALWVGVTLVYNHNLANSIEPFGIFFIETFGAYILARMFVRDYQSFVIMVRCLSAMIVILLPLAIIESVYSINIINNIFGTIFTVLEEGSYSPRFGLDRAQGPFEHPILFGVICSAGFGLSFYRFDKVTNPTISRLRTIFITLSVALSLSVGAFVSIIAQVVIIIWSKYTKKIKFRWKYFTAAFVLFYIVIDIASNRTPFEVFISYMTFNTGNSYNRVLIWHYGTAEVFRHPIFGIGLNDWIRAYWMSSSMDNFWLLNAVRYGLPGFGLLTASVLVNWISIGRLDFSDDRIEACRNGLIITFVGLSVAACTVHLWNGAYVLFMFLLGSGSWMHAEAVRPGNSPSSRVVAGSHPDSMNARPLRRMHPRGARSRKKLTDNSL